MPTAYPTTLDTTSLYPADVTDDTDSKAGTPRTGTVGFLAQWMRDVGGGLLAVETELGADPSGSFSNVKNRLDQHITVRKTADQTFSTVTLANVTDLVFPLAIGLDYTFRFVIPFNAAALTTGIGLTLTGPALTGYMSATVRIPAGTETAQGTGAGTAMAIGGVEHIGYINSFGATDQVVSASTPAITPAMFVAEIFGVVSNPSAAGSLQVQARSEIASSNIIIRRGAHGVLWTS